MIDQIIGFTVYCDICGEEMEYDGYCPVFYTESEAAEAARDAGWEQYEYGKWICPDCAGILNADE